MPKPGALLPSAGLEFALPSVEGNTPSNSAYRIAVTTAGYLHAQMTDTPNSTVRLYYPVGLWFEPGSFASLWKPVGSTIVTEPADTVILYG